jgi:hypothetical protein
MAEKDAWRQGDDAEKCRAWSIPRDAHLDPGKENCGQEKLRQNDPWRKPAQRLETSGQ